MLNTWFPMAVHLLDGLFLGLTNAEALVGQRDKLMALGALSAGLAHELNNPAAAEVRAAEALSGRLQEARRVMLPWPPELSNDEFSKLLDLLTEAVERARSAPTLGRPSGRPGGRSGRPPRGMPAWQNPVGAGTHPGGGRRRRSLAGTGASNAPGLGAGAVRWLSLGLDIESLVGEIRNSAGRISELVGAMKDYSHLDKGPFERSTSTTGSKSTLVIFSHKLKKGVKVVGDYDPALPRSAPRAVSSTRCGPTSSTTPSMPWAAKGR